MERTECDNGEYIELGAYIYKNINLCMRRSFYAVIVGLCSVPYLLPLTKNCSITAVVRWAAIAVHTNKSVAPLIEK